jgi:ArsR family transcriptional regulator, lead/cadmium/zinc/bismuth-responsive transcriptional repressor
MAVTTIAGVRAGTARSTVRAGTAPAVRAGTARSTVRAALHPLAVRAAKRQVPGRGKLDGMEGFFKVLGDATRLRILHALLPGELCVRDVSETLGTSLSAVSHQLAILKAARLVRHRRDGKVIYYSLSDAHVSGVLRSIRNHLSE